MFQDGEVVYRFVQEIESFLESSWHEPQKLLNAVRSYDNRPPNPPKNRTKVP